MRTHTQLVHLKVKNNICDICGNGFTSKQTLNHHLKTDHFQIVNENIVTK